MSRSYKRNRHTGWSEAASEKSDKRRWHGQFRRAVRNAIASETEVMPLEKEISNLWAFAKDGKAYYGSLDDESIRKLDRK